MLAVGVVATLCAVLVPSASADMGPYVFANFHNNRCLDADASRIGANGTPVQLWDCYGAGQTNQRWYLRPVDSSLQKFWIVNLASGRCLDATAQWGGVNGTPIQLWDCYGQYQTNQLWYVEGHGYVYTIRSVAYGRVLDAAWQDIGNNGTPIQLWDDLGHMNQQWSMFHN